MKIVADLHTHTRYSHGKGSVADNVYAAMLKGLEVVAITDHGPRSAPWVGATASGLLAARREVDDLNRRTVGTRVLMGAECNIVSADGALDVPEATRNTFDIVLAGLHPGVRPLSLVDGWALAGRNMLANLTGGLRRKARNGNTKAIVQAVLTNPIDIVTHPGYGLDIDTAELARACARRSTAMEINARHGEMTPQYCQLVARVGAPLVVGSDAHKPEDVGNFDRALSVVSAARLTPEQIINTSSERLTNWLQARRRAGRRRNAVQVAENTAWSDWASHPPGQE